MDISLDIDAQKCEDLWFEDGTIVLQAENTLFRVYSGILARHSPFFKNLFTLPQPSDAEKYEGISLVQLAGDSAQDVHDFLLALHDVDYPQSLLDDAFFLGALLQLSAKYEVSSLRNRVVRILDPLFPTTLLGYDNLMDKKRQPTALTIPFSSTSQLVVLASTLSKAAPSLLPFLLLRLLRVAAAQEDFAFVIDGVEGRGEKRIFLEPDVQRALINGRFALAKLAKVTVLPRIFEPSNCYEECNRERIKYIAKHAKADGHLDPLARRTFKNFCPECRRVLEEDAEAGRKKVWEQLPLVFGLPSWEDLTKLTVEGL